MKIEKKLLEIIKTIDINKISHNSDIKSIDNNQRITEASNQEDYVVQQLNNKFEAKKLTFKLHAITLINLLTKSKWTKKNGAKYGDIIIYGVENPFSTITEDNNKKIDNVLSEVDFWDVTKNKKQKFYIYAIIDLKVSSNNSNGKNSKPVIDIGSIVAFGESKYSEFKIFMCISGSNEIELIDAKLLYENRDNLGLSMSKYNSRSTITMTSVKFDANNYFSAKQRRVARNDYTSYNSYVKFKIEI